MSDGLGKQLTPALASSGRRCASMRPATGARPPSGMPAAPHASARACAPPAMLPCAAASLPPTDPHLQCNSSLATDIKELYSAGQRATSGARESPFTMPFILGERDTKDSAHTLLDMPKNKRRRLDKNLERQAAFSPLCSPSACVCAQVQIARSRQRATGMLAIDEGLIDATDVGQPGKKKKRSVNRKSGGVRRFEAREHH